MPMATTLTRRESDSSTPSSHSSSSKQKLDTVNTASRRVSQSSEHILHEQLGSPAASSSSRSLSISRNGHLSPNPQPHFADLSIEDGDGDIGYSVPAPRQASPVAAVDHHYGADGTPRRDLMRSRTRSPSPSPTKGLSGRQSELGIGVDNPSGPSRPRSTLSNHSPYPAGSPPPSPSPRRPLSNRSHSPHSPTRSDLSPLSSPPLPPRFVPFKSPLPGPTPISDSAQEDHDGEKNGVDHDAPFESIPLQTTPPPQPHSAALPSSPSLHPGSPKLQEKRRSWNGFGGGLHASRSISVPHNGVNEHVGGSRSHNASRTSVSAIPAERSVSASPEASGSTSTAAVARRHAPPAHPHPFPLPTVTSPPPPPTAKRLSVVSTSNPTCTAATSSVITPTHAALGTKGVSAFEKVISHTRPSWLPPKDKTEDEIHYHQWEEMMAKARELEKERRKVEEARRVEKERKLALATPIWEEMLNDKEFSAAKVRNNPRWRQVWFEGAPTYLRGKAWSMAIGNPLAMSKDAYKAYAARARKARDSGRFPQATIDQMEHDLDETLVNLRLFQKGSPLRSDLMELLCAWVVYRSDDGLGYAPYINLLAALFLLTSPPATAFLSLVNFLSRPILRAFYTETADEIDACYRVFENLQADKFPMIFANCKNLGLKVPESWFRSVLVEQVPFEAVCRLWDQIVLDGDGYIFRAALAIFGFLEPRLYYPDHDEILSVLEGRNRATLAITERERERARLRGEAYNDGLDGKMSVFGLSEEALFDWLEKDGWKESRFERLVVREMPD